MTRALTATEKELLRAEGHKSELFLGILSPITVFSAQINQTFTTHDELAELIFDNVAFGAYSDIVSGMTLYIGSAAGLYDLGMVRVRKAATSTVIYFGEASDVDFADDLYLTVVDEMQIWAKHLRVVDGVTYIDYDVEYTNQHDDLDPVAVLGSAVSALWLSSGTVDYEPTGSASWVLGSTISGYSWSATGGSVVDETTDAPTFTFTAAGTYRISCTVAAANGKTSTGHRYVLVYDADNMPITEFTLSSCVGAGDGWSFGITMYDDLGAIRRNSLGVLFTRDYYGDTQISIGAQSGNENILAIGWMDEETTDHNPELDSTTCKFYSADHWLGKLPSFPTGFENTQDTPSAWTEFYDLTVDKAAWHLLHWRTTVAAIMDVRLTGDTRLASSLESATGSAWAQLQALSFEAILAQSKVNQYCGLHLAIDSQYLPEADRTAIPIILDIEESDWRNTISRPRAEISSVARLEVSGIVFDGSTGKPYFSRANGNIFKQHGSIIIKDRLLLDSQEQINVLAGLIFNKENNPDPKIRIPMASNFRMADIAPVQYMQIDGDKIIPRRITHTFDAKAGVLLTDVENEDETFEGLSVTYERPQTPISNFPPLPDIADFPIEPFNFAFDVPNVVAIDPEGLDDFALCNLTDGINGGYDLHIRGTMVSNGDLPFAGKLNCHLRSSAHTYHSYVYVDGTWWTLNSSTGNYDEDETDFTWYEVYALDITGTRVATATKETVLDFNRRKFTFDGLSANTRITGIEIALTLTGEADYDTAVVTSTYTETPTTYRDRGGYYLNGEEEWALGHAQWREDYFSLDFPALQTRWADIWVKVTASTIVAENLLYLSFQSIGLGSIKELHDYWFHDDPDYDSDGRYENTFYALRFLNSDQIKLALNIRTWGSQTITSRLQVFIREAAGHRLTINNVKIYNICPSVLTE